MQEAINSNVRDKPAIFKVFRDDNGETIREVLRVDNNMLYMLTFSPTFLACTKNKTAPL